jgi:hypothetical protein
MVETNAGGLVVFRDAVGIPLAAVVSDPTFTWERAAYGGDLETTAQLRQPAAVPLEGSSGRLHLPAGAASSLPPGSIVLGGQQFGPHWQLTPAGGGGAPEAQQAFGWSVGFDYRPTVAGFTMRFTGQALRTAEVVLLSVLWLCALWITRRPSRTL